jgi:hypothetical protein
MEYRYIQIIDTRQYVTYVADKCKKIGMLGNAHARDALRFRPGIDKMAPYHKILGMKTPNVSVLKTGLPYIKVFGWSLVAKVEDREYVIEELSDIVRIFEDYRDGHGYIRWYLEKDLLKGHGGPSVSRLMYGTIKDIHLETLRAAVERIGGHLFIRQVKRTHNINKRYRKEADQEA